MFPKTEFFVCFIVIVSLTTLGIVHFVQLLQYIPVPKTPLTLY